MILTVCLNVAGSRGRRAGAIRAISPLDFRLRDREQRRRRLLNERERAGAQRRCFSLGTLGICTYWGSWRATVGTQIRRLGANRGTQRVTGGTQRIRKLGATGGTQRRGLGATGGTQIVDEFRPADVRREFLDDDVVRGVMPVSARGAKPAIILQPTQRSNHGPSR